MIKYYDREGYEVSAERFKMLMEDPKYQLVKTDQVGNYLVSTVFVGVDLNMKHHWVKDKVPHIYETIVFYGEEGDANWTIMDLERYPDLESAKQGHKEMIWMIQRNTKISKMTDITEGGASAD